MFTILKYVYLKKMWYKSVYLVLAVFICEYSPVRGILLVLPEDVATGFAAIYGFSPRIFKGNDHRFGFGFRFGNHADLQLLYELGPQLTTNTIQPRVRSVRYRERARRPVLEFLLRAGFVKEARAQVDFDYNSNECDEPR